MTAMDEVEIDGQSFYVPSNKPVREQPKPHECVCLLIHQQVKIPTADDLMEIAAGFTTVEKVMVTREIRDKCHGKVDNPDQPFCYDCEQAGHPDEHNQAGLNVRRD